MSYYGRSERTHYGPSRSRSRSRSRDRSPTRKEEKPAHRFSNPNPLIGSNSSGTSGNGHQTSGSLLDMTMPRGSFPPSMNPSALMQTGFANNAPLKIPTLPLPQEKVNRELFVGNTPPGTSELLLMQFLNGAMKRTNLVPSNSDHVPIIQCRVNSKFAFIECASVEDANKALNLNGIPFMNMSLRVSRPSKYAGPYVPSKTWQQLTGKPLPPGITPIPENSSNLSAEEKVNRELFIGNTTAEMTEQSLKDFLGKAMEQVGLTNEPGNPITACRVSGKFAFIELRTPEEAANALNLNNIPYLGATLRVGRPSKYTGVHTPHGNWEDILSKYMSGELKLPSEGGTGIQTATTFQSALKKVTTVVELKNMLTADDLSSDKDYHEILEDTKEECATFGNLEKIVIPRSGPGATKIFLKYSTQEDAANAVKSLQGRTFDGKKVEAIFCDEEKFDRDDYSD